MSRAFYDKTLAEWKTVADAISRAGGDTITLPARHLMLIAFGYEQYQRERTAALAWIDSAESSGYLDNTAAAFARHVLGEISDEQLADEVRAAAQHGEGL